MIKKILKKYFDSLAYFYSYLKYRILVVFFLSLLIGILDGLGLTMFLPMLQMVSESGSVNSEGLGKLGFLIEFMRDTGLPMTLLTVLAFMAFFFCAKGCIQYLASIYRVNVLQWFIKGIRYRHINGLKKLDYNYFVKSDVGHIQNTLTGEVSRVAQSFRSYFEALQSLILVMVYMMFAFFIDFQFAFLVSIGGIATNFLFKKLYEKTKGTSRKLTGENSRFQSLIIQNVANYKYLKATGSLTKYSRKLKKSISDIERSNKKIGRLDAILNSSREPILVLIVVLVIYIQTVLLGSPLGPILLSLVFFYRALTYLMQMQLRYNKFLAVSGSLENTKKFEKGLKSHQEKKGDKILNDSIENLKLSNASFSYQDSQVLYDISLEIKRNETVAFVGESGSGKTTLINIIAGLLPIENGEYLINGEKRECLNVESLQKKIGYITQDPVIFGDSIYNNVCFWAEKTEENERKFKEALKLAAIYDYVKDLPEKEETILGNNGINLSGGQRQRISIARELFKQAEILILDEATSALDSETEKAIQQNIDQLKGRYTILIIAHRIATIKNADRIVIMNQGQIKSIGRFEELIMKSSYFKKLVELQEL